MMNSVWDSIEIGCMKRVSVNHNLFWAKDYNGSLAFIIELENVKYKDLPVIRISGMQIIYKEDNGIVKIYLILNDLQDIDIFNQLCTDIINVIDIENYRISASSVINRLRQWQDFLSSHKKKTYPIEEQVGLFGELSFLYHKLFPKIGVTKSLVAWVGPIMDKQDFRLDNVNIEIKAYLDNHRGIVNISSIEQLNPSNGKIYLYTYGLKIDETGFTLDDFIKLIKEYISKNNSAELATFDKLLSQYGYFDGYKYENLLNFLVFEETMFNVDDDFPRLPISLKRKEIKSIIYILDTNLCMDFSVPTSELNQILNKE